MTVQNCVADLRVVSGRGRGEDEKVERREKDVDDSR